MDEIDRAVALVKAVGDKIDGSKESRAEQLECLLGKARGLGDIALAKYPPIDWTIMNLLPTGFAIFSGGSKLGKTWICLQLASAVSLGLDFLGNSDYRCKKGGVLLLALQISDRMLHNRMEVAGIMGDDRVKVLHTFPSGEEALEAVRRWKELHPDTRLVIIDMLEQVRDRDPEHENTYSVNVKEISRWAALADELKIAILGTTHDRKAISGDFVSDIVGSVGAVGSAAVLWSLKRSRGKADATLFASGWEIMDHELPLQFDQSTGWQLLPGTVAAVTLTRERQEILDFLIMQKEPVTPSTIAIALEKRPGSVRKLLMELKNDHFVECPRYGLYVYSNTSNSSNSNSSNGRGKSVTTVTVTSSVPSPPKKPPAALSQVDSAPPDDFEDDPLPEPAKKGAT